MGKPDKDSREERYDGTGEGVPRQLPLTVSGR
jgi:hypothetical protein